MKQIKIEDLPKNAGETEKVDEEDSRRVKGGKIFKSPTLISTQSVQTTIKTSQGLEHQEVEYEELPEREAYRPSSTSCRIAGGKRCSSDVESRKNVSSERRQSEPYH